MRHLNRVLVAGVLGVSLLMTPFTDAPAKADVAGDTARKIVSSYGAGAVTLQIVLKSSSGDGGDQAEREIDGVVLDSSGLIVTANTSVDPGAAYAVMSGDDSYATKVVGVKILASGGQEIPARVVLRDKDRNLAFLRPLQKPKVALVPISFAKRANARIGDAIYILSRLGKTGGRQSSVTSERIVSVIQKPRLMYVIMPNMYSALGNVVFNESGQVLGLLTARIGLKTGDSPLPVVVPTQDIMEIARQVPPANKLKN